jgi:thiamine-phosphate pyrophosphorylase
VLSFDPVLCLVTDRTLRPENEFLPTLEAALKAGVTWVQFREKSGLSDRAIWELGLRVREITRRYGLPLIVDDRLDLAMALDADGVHLGQTDLPLSALKALWTPQKLWGISVQNLAQAEAAVRDGASYLGVGALFPTASKADAVATAHSTVTLMASLGVPLVGIGGITPERMPQVRRLGCTGVAVISAIWGNADPAQAVRSFLEAWQA